ncbi:type III pantothenate kinase [Marinagarivorans cellulosilyticus]|uniref:Type III pantothenate kinase n=1 Tax=Marinagarivorans cellulosilyticus TaxID=2721545 RepID=A0AAN1WEI6_9GAMM|nr:type III pantothenate kinase [Marinagarivorans cellulosilyticus]BCD96118.1 type III pantothenate kinase [Marinagarivorans cellulosilyticus]
MIVDVDIGNTNAKWRCQGDSRIYVQSTRSLPQAWQYSGAAITRVRVACVAGADVLQCFAAAVRERWGIDIELARVQRNYAGLAVCYEDVSRLGVDRWLAMLAAFKSVGDEFVAVSAGSALTADWVAQDGQHLGGFIAPGRERMLASLYGDVANVLLTPRVPGELLDIALGQSTETCVDGGVAVLLRGFINHVASRCLGARIILAGGDAQAMLTMCAQEHKFRVSLVSNPVLDGLAIALP